MKSGIAGFLILAGLAMLVLSMFIGNKIAAEQEWSEEKTEEFSKLTSSIHGPPNRDQEDPEEARNRVKAMRQELIDAKDQATGKKKMLYWPGLGLTVLGICFQIWAWLDKQRA